MTYQGLITKLFTSVTWKRDLATASPFHISLILASCEQDKEPTHTEDCVSGSTLVCYNLACKYYSRGTDTLAYKGVESITTVKSFIVHAFFYYVI
jgi:hypothetical protein